MTKIANFKFWLTGIPPREQFDVCMCGSYMVDHNMGSGHSPVSVGDYCTRPPAWKRAFHAILCKFGRHGRVYAEYRADFSIMKCERCQRPLSVDFEVSNDFFIR